jgi:hypothetical protein
MRYKLKNRFRTLLLIFMVLIINSCKDSFNTNFENIKVEGALTPSYAVPLVDAKFTLKELLPDDDDLNRYLTIDDNDFITIAYKDQVAEYLIDDFMDGEPLSGSSLPFIQYSIDPQIINLNLNTILSQGSIYLANPSLKIIITNYWDIPAKFKFKDFYYYKEENSDAIPVTGQAVTEWDTIPGPGPIHGDSIVYKIVLDTATSNVDELISALPHHISFGADFETIPGDPYDLPAGSVNKLGIEVSIPLELRLTNILFTDTLDFNIGVDPDSANISSLTINFIADNGFPLGMNSQVYFTDENYMILDSLFENSRFNLKPGIGSGKEIESVESKVTIKLSGERMDKILAAKYLIPSVLFNTTDAANNVNIKLYSTFEFGLKLSAKADMEITME